MHFLQKADVKDGKVEKIKKKRWSVDLEIRNER